MRIFENILKACCVIGLVAVVVLIVGFFILGFFDFPNSEEYAMKFFEVCFGVFMTFGLIVFFAAFTPESVLKKLQKYDKSKAYKAKAPYKTNVIYDDFNSLKSLLESALKGDGYRLFETETEDREDKIYIYYKRHRQSTFYFVIMYADNEEIEVLLNKVSVLFEQCMNKNGKRSSIVYVSSVLCVNRVSSAFYRYLGDTSVTSNFEYELRAGYSFGGKTLYIGVSSMEEVGIIQRKKLRRNLLNMLNIPNDFLRNN